MSAKNILSVGMNRKLAKDIGVFNLPPQVTCPGRTAACSKLCYALKADRLYKSARQSRIENFELTKGPEFTGLIIAAIKKAKVKKVRIHESGDFYDQNYLNKWIKVIKQLPDVTFLAYTKSFHLDFSGIPANFVLYFSTDQTTTAPKPAGREAYLVPKDTQNPTGMYACAPRKDHNYCGSSCNVCWNGSQSVCWTQH